MLCSPDCLGVARLIESFASSSLSSLTRDINCPYLHQFYVDNIERRGPAPPGHGIFICGNFAVVCSERSRRLSHIHGNVVRGELPPAPNGSKHFVCHKCAESSQREQSAFMAPEGCQMAWQASVTICAPHAGKRIKCPLGQVPQCFVRNSVIIIMTVRRRACMDANEIT
jgi:hypothetical protein